MSRRTSDTKRGATMNSLGWIGITTLILCVLIPYQAGGTTRHVLTGREIIAQQQAREASIRAEAQGRDVRYGMTREEHRAVALRIAELRQATQAEELHRWMSVQARAHGIVPPASIRPKSYEARILPPHGEIEPFRNWTPLQPSSETTSITEVRQPAEPIPHRQPTAEPVPGKPGIVISPFAPEQGYVDVRGLTPGLPVRDPYTGKVFLVP